MSKNLTHRTAKRYTSIERHHRRILIEELASAATLAAAILGVVWLMLP